ncbi:hypothetical protein AC792_15085 [Arthrobacter sp. RIT-PI-e]|uniref:hypothetical protein n=1 Tax=Arthrobacter sp. RIT-PI-e TaxID=1681197 RepID=UPI00067663B8|nr:hypothetical protein [Arthrobacter sp. RIT-PI-e]KNC17251.1 hypothetical protein AC792_15085 [Arthrobacter sp. RIT-PI-e]
MTERAPGGRRPWEAWHPSGRGILGAVVTGIIAYVAAWLMAFLVLVLTLSSLARSGTGEPGGLQEGLTEAVQAGPDPDPSTALATILVLPTQLVGMAFLGPLDVQVGFEMFGLGLALAGTLAWVPLAVTATAFLVAAGSSYLARRRRPLDPRRSTVLAACSGVTVAVLAWVATAATAVDLQEEGLSFSVSAASPVVLLGAFLVVAAGVLVGAAAARRGGSQAPAPVRWVVAVLQVLALHYVLVTVLAGIGLLVAVGVRSGPAVLPSAFAWLPTTTGSAYGLVHLAPVSTALGAETGSLTLFDLPWWGWLSALVVLLLATLVGALAWAARMRILPPVPALLSWAVLPGVFLAGGALVTALTRVSGTLLGVPGITSAEYGPVPWTCLVLSGWALVITVLARFAAPAVLATWPRLATLPVLGSGAGVKGAGSIGIGLQGAGSDGAGTGTTRAGTPSPRRVKLLVAAGSTAVLVLLGAVITVNLVNESVYGPDEPVEAYLGALVAGDVTAAQEVLPSNVGEGRSALLDSAVYGAAQHRISSYTVTGSSRTDDTATVTVTVELTQDGEVSTRDLTLTRTGSTGVLFDDWRLDGPEPVNDVSIAVPQELRAVTVNGTEVELPVGDADSYTGLRSVTFPALPGEYTITPPAASTYLSYGDEQSVLVPAAPGGTPRGVLFASTPTPAVEAEATARVREVLTGCIASTEPSPRGCPNRAFLFGSPGTVRGANWVLDAEPTFTLDESYLPGVYTLLSDDAEATFSYERNVEFDPRRPARWEPEEDTVRLYLRATVTVAAESIDVRMD